MALVLSLFLLLISRKWFFRVIFTWLSGSWGTLLLVCKFCSYQLCQHVFYLTYGLVCLVGKYAFVVYKLSGQ